MEKKRGQRKGAAYIPYDYEAAYQNQLEALDMYFIEQLVRCGGARNVYATKEIRSGEQLEVEIYPEFTRAQRSEIPSEGLKKKNRQAQRNLNDKNSRKQCERVINENFGDEDIWATFTYMDEYMPVSMEVAHRNVVNYIKRVNYHRKKLNLGNARYVYVTECSPNGRWHHHIVMDGALDMDVVEALWKLGERNEVRRLSKDENGLSGLANYITKDKGRKGQKTWTPSKGLKQPEVKVNHYKFRQKDINAIVQGKEKIEEHLKRWYGKHGYIYTSSEVRYNDWNGRFYIRARLRKPKEGAKKREDKQACVCREKVEMRSVADSRSSNHCRRNRSRKHESGGNDPADGAESSRKTRE